MTFYVTTPIYYANSLPHLGHLYTMIVADTIARRKRQQGIETFFLTGTDEHGINIERAAKRNNRTPREQADYVVSYFKKMTAAQKVAYSRERIKADLTRGNGDSTPPKPRRL